MNQITIPINPSQEDIETLKTLFNKYSKEKQGLINKEEIALLLLELANKPPSYQVSRIFDAGKTQALDQNSFLMWYLSYNIQLPHLSNLFIGLRQVEKEIQTAAPLDASKQSLKESYIKLSSQTNENTLTNQVFFDVLLNPEKTQSRLNKYQQIIKKQTNSFGFALNFHLDANPVDIKEKVEGLVSQLKAMGTEMLGPHAGFLDLVNIDVGNNESEVVIVFSSDFIVFKLLTAEFDRVLKLLSPTFHAEISALIRCETISKIMGNATEGLNASSTIDFKIDSVLLNRIKQILWKSYKNIPQQIGGVIALLLQQVQLELKMNNIKEQVTSAFGLPNINLAAQIGGIKQQVDISGIIESFLPPSSQELVKIIKNAESTNATIDLFFGCLNFRANFVLAGTNDVLSAIL